MHFGNLEKVKETFEALEASSRKYARQESLLKALHALGAVSSQVHNSPMFLTSMELRKLDEAKEKLKEARGIAEQLNDSKTLGIHLVYQFLMVQARVCASLGLVFSVEGIPEVAIKYLEESLKLAKQSRDIR